MPGPAPQNVAHVRPMPQLVKQTVVQSTSPTSDGGQELLKNPKQLYQMVSVEINGVHKKVMVPVSAPSPVKPCPPASTSAGSITSAAVVSQPAPVTAQIPSTPISTVPEPQLKEAYTIQRNPQNSSNNIVRSKVPQPSTSSQQKVVFPRSLSQGKKRLVGPGVFVKPPKRLVHYPAVSTASNRVTSRYDVQPLLVTTNASTSGSQSIEKSLQGPIVAPGTAVSAAPASVFPKCFLAQMPDGKKQLVILPQSTGTTTATTTLFPTPMVSSTSVQSSEPAPLMPRLGVAPTHCNVSTKTTTVASNVSTLQSPAPVQCAQLIQTADGPILGYLIGNQLLVPHNPMFPVTTSTTASSSMPTYTTNTPFIVAQAPTMVQPMMQPTQTAGNTRVSTTSTVTSRQSVAEQCHPVVSNDLKIETVFSLRKNLSQGNAQPQVIEIKPDSDEESMDYEDTYRQSSDIAFLGSVASSHVSEASPHVSEASSSSSTERAQTYTSAAPVSSSSGSIMSTTHGSQSDEPSQGNVPRLAPKPMDGGTSINVFPVSSSTASKGLEAKGATNATTETIRPQRYITPSMLQQCQATWKSHGHEYSKKKPTARKSTSKPPRIVVQRKPFKAVQLRIGKGKRPFTFTSFALLKKCFPYVKNCKVQMLRLSEKTTRKYNVKLPERHSQRVDTMPEPAVAPPTLVNTLPLEESTKTDAPRSLVNALPLEESTKTDAPPSSGNALSLEESTKTDAPPSSGNALPLQEATKPDVKSRLFSSDGQRMKITQTGRKTVIQPSLSGPDKGKFLMIKTNAGTFLVPVNQGHANVSGKGSATNSANEMKILSPLADEDKKKLTPTRTTTTTPEHKLRSLLTTQHKQPRKTTPPSAPNQHPPVKKPKQEPREEPIEVPSDEPEEPDEPPSSVQPKKPSPKKRHSPGTSSPRAVPFSAWEGASTSQASEVKSQASVEDAFAEEKKAAKTVPRGSASDRIRLLKEKLAQQQVDTNRAKQAIQNSRNVLETIDLD